MSSYKIIIGFEIKDGKMDTTVDFENNPMVHDALIALETANELFEQVILENANRNRIFGESFRDYVEKLKVNDLDE